MKRNNLTTAVIAGIAGIAGFASVSTAVNLNSDGTGQVLVYPYYTVNNGLNTLISVVNTTDETKAVKVRFLEGRNSRECLDFNLFLSAYDVWTAALIPAQATSLFSPGHEGEDTVKIVTADTSCLDPSIIQTTGFEFLPYGYDPLDNGTGGYDLQGLNLERCTEGHFEMIEMGVVTDAITIAGIDHGTNGVPGDCGVIVDNFEGGIWSAAPFTGIDPPTGGIFGSASIIDINNGTDVAYNADAIEAFTNEVELTGPGSLNPNLASGGGIGAITSNIFNNGAVVSDVWLNSAVEAVSAIYMHDSIYGEYALLDGIGANTEWVVTFPTKNFYIDALLGANIGAVPFEPFTTTLNPAGTGACEIYTFQYYDREEQVPDPRLIIRPPSPRPPGVGIDDAVFCWETNVVEFEDSQRLSGDSIILGSRNTTHLITQSVSAQAATPTSPAVGADYFTEGWTAIHFAQTTDNNADTVTYTGLPVTGFAIQRYTNANVGGGILANYAGIFAHRYSRNIQ